MGAWIVAGLVFMLFGVGPNTALSLLAGVLLVVGVTRLWRPGEPPILLFIFLNQWAQATFGLFYANWLDIEVDQVGRLGGHQEFAIILSMLGLLFLTIGLRAGAGSAHPDMAARARRIVMAHPPATWLRLFLCTWIFGAVCVAMATQVPGLSQLLLAFAAMKWTGYFMLTYVTFLRPDVKRGPWLAIFLFEFLFSLGGFFSSFKEVFAYTLIAFGAANARFRPGTILTGAATFVAMIYCALLWQSVKVEFRGYLNGGAGTQIEVGEYVDRLATLGELIMKVEARDIGEAADSLVRRLIYTEYFGVVLHVVPDIVPHENGALWYDSVTRPLMPRILFPDKGSIDESVLTSKYTGFSLPGMERGTQISIGYMGESYIDFGPAGMMLCIGLWGYVLGRCYRWLTTDSRLAGVVGFAMTGPVLWPMVYLESSTAKLVGGLSANMLAAWLIAKFVAPRYLAWTRDARATPEETPAPLARSAVNPA